MAKFKELIQSPPMPEGNAEQQVGALRDYILRVVEELQYLLTHLEAENIDDTTFQKIAEMIPKASVTAPPMDGQGRAGGSSAWARGDHQHPEDTNKANVTALEAEAAAREAHEDNTSNPHEVTKAQVGLGNVANERQYSVQNPPPTPTPGEVGAIPVTEKGSAGGVAELDANGMVPSAQLPSYVDDVLEYASLSDFPVTGESGKIYVALDTNRTYRWSGSAYVEISESLALGETSSTAYRGDRGKTAYDHSQVTSGNPHNVSASDVGLGNVANERQYSAQNPPPLPTPADIGAATAQDLSDHVGDTANPHGVTAAQVGLDQVANERQYSANNPPPAPDAEDVPYDNTGSGLMATDVQAAIDELAQGGGGGGTAASAVSYDNTGSGLTATNVQDAIDEVYDDIPSQPSDIGAQDEITASGILKGDGAGGVSAATPGTDYQAPLTIDATPTANSTNPVQSGGVYTDVRTRVPNYGKGKNLLRNWYFVGGGTGRGVFPVNQRGVTSGQTQVVYGIDGWKWDYGGSIGAYSIISNGLKLTPASSGSTARIIQIVNGYASLGGKKLTASVLLSDGTLKYGTITRTNATDQTIQDDAIFGIDIRSNGTIRFLAKAERTLQAVKLELGTEQTLAHQENGVWVLNEIPDYEEELIKCQTSTADSSDTYANKSLATEQDLTSIQATGTTNTTGAVIPDGAYFYLNGVLYRAKTQIDVNATFTVNTNCELVPAGGFNNLRLKHMDITVTPSAVGNVQINSNTGNAVTYNNFVNAVVIDNTGTSIFVRIFTYANLIYANVIDLSGNYITTQVKIRVYYV